jgi:TatD DNase family protein
MKIDIHRHAADKGGADFVLRNLFHSQTSEIKKNRFYSIGLHPWNVSAESITQDIEKVKAFALHKQVIAIGEAGLDKTIKTLLELQHRAFEEQIRISVEADKPLIIHCVRAYNEVMEYRIKSNPDKPWIIHWFNANEAIGLQFIKKGFYLSFGHMLFNDRSKAYHAFPHIPLNAVFLETDDAGYGIEEIYRRAALLRGITEEELEQQVESNFYKCFSIRP